MNCDFLLQRYGVTTVLSPCLPCWQIWINYLSVLLVSNKGSERLNCGDSNWICPYWQKIENVYGHVPLNNHRSPQNFCGVIPVLAVSVLVLIQGIILIILSLQSLHLPLSVFIFTDRMCFVQEAPHHWSMIVCWFRDWSMGWGFLCTIVFISTLIVSLNSWLPLTRCRTSYLCLCVGKVCFIKVTLELCVSDLQQA